jgi:hypothetical protein
MQLPSSIETMFNSTYDEFRAVRVGSAMQCNNIQATLREARVSFATKIVKSKKHGKEFIVMLLDTPDGT